MSYDNLEKLLELHEGRVPHAYQDSLGWWTIGVGHLIDKRKGGKLPDEFITLLLRYDIRQKTAQLEAALPWVRELDPVRYAVLADMCFNLGIAGLLGFKNTLKEVEAGNYEAASKRMLLSRWATQVGRRATRLSEMMRTGQWPKE